MKFKEINRDKGNPPRFILKEEEINSFLNSKSNYSVGEIYRCYYELTCNFAGGNQRTLKFGSENEFKFSETQTTLRVNSKGKRVFEVIFSPRTEGLKVFQLVIIGTARQGSLIIINKQLSVDMIRPLNITGYVENTLPIEMTLGEKKRITFVFENNSNRDVKNFEIIIKQKKIKNDIDKSYLSNCM